MPSLLPVQSLKRAVSSGQDDLAQLRRIHAKLQADIAQLDGKTFTREHIARKAQELRQEAQAQANALLAKNETFRHLETCWLQRSAWSNRRYLQQLALTVNEAPVPLASAEASAWKQGAAKTGRLRLAWTVGRLSHEDLSDFAAAAAERQNWTLLGLSLLEASGRLSRGEDHTGLRAVLTTADGAEIHEVRESQQAIAEAETLLRAISSGVRALAGDEVTTRALLSGSPQEAERLAAVTPGTPRPAA
jgi:hypothetical protein